MEDEATRSQSPAQPGVELVAAVPRAPSPQPPPMQAAPAAAEGGGAPTVAAGELYRFTARHSLLLFVLAFALHVPLIIEDLFSHKYTVHKNGVVLITGASTGIGQHAALELARKNYTVLAGVRRREDENALKALNEPRLLPVTLDVTKPRDVQRAFDMAKKEVDKGLPFVALINNAGLAKYVPLEFHDPKSVDEMVSVNLVSLIKVTQKFLPLLRQSKGRIVNLSSTLGRLFAPEYAVSTATKHAVEGLSDALRTELLALGVSVSVVQPGYVKSAMHDKALDAKSVPEAAKVAYSHLFTPARLENHERHVKKATSPSVTSGAIVHAVTSSHPRTRYAVGQVDDVPASVLMWFNAVLPDRLLDRLLLRD